MPVKKNQDINESLVQMNMGKLLLNPQIQTCIWDHSLSEKINVNALPNLIKKKNALSVLSYPFRGEKYVQIIECI